MLDPNSGAVRGIEFVTSQLELCVGELQCAARQSSLSVGSITSIAYLTNDRADQQQSHRSEKQSIKSYGIIDRLIDKPREAGLISLIVGVVIGAIGITLYLNRGWKIGFLLLVIGGVTPLFPWWLALLIVLDDI